MELANYVAVAGDGVSEPASAAGNTAAPEICNLRFACFGAADSSTQAVFARLALVFSRLFQRPRGSESGIRGLKLLEELLYSPVSFSF